MKEKIIYKSDFFYYGLIVYLILLIIINLYNLTNGVYISILPLVIQSIILTLVITKNKLAKSGVNLWSIILILGPTLSLLGKLIKGALADGFNFEVIFKQVLLLSIGITIYYYNKTTTEISK